MSAAGRLDVPIPRATDCHACQVWSHAECVRRRSHLNPCTCWCTSRLTLAPSTSTSAPAPRAPSVDVLSGTVVQLRSAAERRPSHDPEGTARRMHPAGSNAAG